MEKTVFGSFQDFENYIGKEVGVTDYLEITQDQINKFADATLDYQWIHTEPERAKIESPFGTTIAHGYLTLSLLKYFWDEIIDVQNVKVMINYGIESFRFGEPVLVNSKVRVRIFVHSAVNLRGTAKIQTKVKMEIEAKKKPAFEGVVTFLFTFDDK
ncbi:MAG: MaoC family dehydratase [Bacteroidales bacterium]|nr:MaoC family dehydratase [Bacteroidales bacterium]